MTTHQIKSWPEYFAPTATGAKPFDLRKDDRNYQVGDIVQLEEFAPATETYSGHVLQRRISFILREFPGLMPGYCVLGFMESAWPRGVP